MLQTLLLMMCGLWAFAAFWAYIVPAMPFLIWAAAIVGWLVLTVEAIIAAPVWLVGHAMPEGEGFAGQHGRQGYLLIMSILLRPSLLVACMYACMLILFASGKLIGPLFILYSESRGTIANSGLGGAVFSYIILGSLITIMTWKIFHLVTELPDRILRWVGQSIHNLGSESAQAMGQDVIGGARSAGGSTISNAAKGTTSLGDVGRAVAAKEKQAQIATAEAAHRGNISQIASALSPNQSQNRATSSGGGKSETSEV